MNINNILIMLQIYRIKKRFYVIKKEEEEESAM